MILGSMWEVRIRLASEANCFCKNPFNKSLDASSKPTNGSSKIIRSDSLAKTLIKANFFCCPKDRLAVNLSSAPLYDTPLFTKNLEIAYKKIYQRSQKGLQPDHIYVD